MCKEFFAVLETGGKDQNTVENVALEPRQSPQLPRTPRQSLRQGRQMIEEVLVPVMQPVQIVEKATGSSEDDHRQGV